MLRRYVPLLAVFVALQIFQLLITAVDKDDQLYVLLALCAVAPLFNWASSLLHKESDASAPAIAPRCDLSMLVLVLTYGLMVAHVMFINFVENTKVRKLPLLPGHTYKYNHFGKQYLYLPTIDRRLEKRLPP